MSSGTGAKTLIVFKFSYGSSNVIPLFDLSEVASEGSPSIGGTARDMILSPDGCRLVVTFKGIKIISYNILLI